MFIRTDELNYIRCEQINVQRLDIEYIRHYDRLVVSI